eukprot:scaffold215038_cov40-Attheya_sp.AAC.4
MLAKLGYSSLLGTVHVAYCRLLRLVSGGAFVRASQKQASIINGKTTEPDIGQCPVVVSGGFYNYILVWNQIEKEIRVEFSEWKQ